MGPIELFAGIAFLAGVSLVLWLVIRLLVRRWNSRNWPQAQGTVQNGIVERNTAGEGSPTFSCLLQYTYTVEGVTYAGLFALAAESEDGGKRLLSRVQGHSALVSYHPRDPQNSFLAEKEIEGIPVQHGPQFVNFAPDLGTRLSRSDLTAKPKDGNQQ